MYKFTEYVNASDIWPTAENHQDKGERTGLVRGYNIEIKRPDGTTYWESCCWFGGAPEQYYNSDYYMWHFDEYECVPTGRICFRGYGEEYYDPDERDYFIKPVKDEEVE